MLVMFPCAVAAWSILTHFLWSTMQSMEYLLATIYIAIAWAGLLLSQTNYNRVPVLYAFYFCFYCSPPTNTPQTPQLIFPPPKKNIQKPLFPTKTYKNIQNLPKRFPLPTSQPKTTRGAQRSVTKTTRREPWEAEGKVISSILGPFGKLREVGGGGEDRGLVGEKKFL